MTIEGVDDIREESLMTRDLCVRLVGFGDGLERDIDITLVFDNFDMDFDSEGTKLSVPLDLTNQVKLVYNNERSP